jgi:hypothetical protein
LGFWARLFELSPTSGVSWLRAAIVAAGCLGTALVVRLPLDPIVHAEAPFATVYPAVLIAGLAGGLRAAWLVVLAGGPVAQLLFAATYMFGATLVWFLTAIPTASIAAIVRGRLIKLRAERDAARADAATPSVNPSDS